MEHSFLQIYGSNQCKLAEHNENNIEAKIDIQNIKKWNCKMTRITVKDKYAYIRYIYEIKFYIITKK